MLGLNATDLDTRGPMKIAINKATALPLWHDFMVVPTLNWDALFGADRLQVDVREYGASGLDWTTTMKASLLSQLLTGTIACVTEVGGGVIGSLGFVSDGVIGSVGHVEAIGDKTGYGLAADQSAVTIGTVAHAASVATINAVGTVAHLISVGDKTGYDLNADQSAVIIGTLGFVSDGLIGTVTHAVHVGSAAFTVGTVAWVANGIIGTVGHALHVGSVYGGFINTVDIVGTVGWIGDGMLGTLTHCVDVGSAPGGDDAAAIWAYATRALTDKDSFNLAADQSAVVLGTVAHAAEVGGGIIGSVGFLSDGLVGSLGFVSAGIIGTLGRALSVGSMDAGIIGTISHAQTVGTIAGIISGAANDIADALLERDINQVEATAAKHSLTSAILKAVSKIIDDAGTLKVYRTDGATLHLSQVITVGSSNQPIDSLGVGT